MTAPNEGRRPPDHPARPPGEVAAIGPGPGRDLVMTGGGSLEPTRRTATTLPLAGAKIDALSLLKAFRRRWAPALGLGILCAGIGAAAAWFAIPPSKYTAKAMLYVSSKRPSIIFKTSEDQTDFGMYQQTQQTLIKSRLVLNAALRDPEAGSLGIIKHQPDPVVWLEKQIRASYQGEILTIAMDGSSSEALPALVNAVTTAYLDEVVNVDVEERKRRFDALKEIYSGYQAKLKERRGILDKLAEQLGSKDKDTVRLTHQLAVENRGLIERELVQLRNDLRKAEAELKVRREALRDQAAGTVPETVLESYVEKDEEIMKFRNQIYRLKSLLSRHNNVVKKGSDPALRDIHRELDEVQDDLAARLAQVRPWYAARLTERLRSGQDSDLSLLEERIRIMREMERVTSAELDSLSVETKSINKGSLDLERIQDEIEHTDTIAKKVGDEIEVLNVELQAPPRVRLIEEADAPRLEADKRPKMAGMAGLAAFGLALLGVSLYEHRARRIGSVDEVVYGLGMRIVGTLPQLPGRAKGRRELAARGRDDHYRYDLLIESIDATRAMLLHAADVESIQVAMVASPMAGEGKTSLSCHLATSLARAGRRTLLLDADMRSPKAHLLFDAPPEPGLCEFLRGEVDLDDVIQPISSTGLWLIAAGRCDTQAIQALALPTATALFRSLRERFDFVIVDTSPVLLVADTLLIGKHVDAVICSILNDVSRLPKVHAANERLQALGIPILGAVMAGTRIEGYGSAYRYYGRHEQAGRG